MQCIALRAVFILAEWCSLRVILESTQIRGVLVELDFESPTRTDSVGFFPALTGIRPPFWPVNP